MPAHLRRGFGIERVLASLSDDAAPGVPATVGGLATAGIYPRGTGAPSAVLVPLFEEDGETRVVLTRRSAWLRSHTGEVAFPGGRIDPGEDVQAAALREAEEEIGLAAGAVKIAGELRSLRTLAGATAIRAFVGAVDRRPALAPNPAEVELVFDVALRDLVSDGVWHEERWDLPGRRDIPVYFYELADDTVWGATARILTDLLARVVPPAAN